MDDGIVSEFKQLTRGALGLIRSEIHLAGAETRYAIKDGTKRTVTLGICGALSVMGLLSLLAFMVIGLGELVDGRYWLSALMVSALLLVPAAAVALSAIKILKQDVSFQNTKKDLQRSKVLLKDHLRAPARLSEKPKTNILREAKHAND